MALDFWERWGARRRHERDQRRREAAARDSDVRERAFGIVREVAEPLVAEGTARLDWLEPDEEGQHAQGARLTPARSDALTVELDVEWGSVILQLGRITEELDPDGPDEDWEDDLRCMLEAVVHGGLSELIEPKRYGYRRTLVFRRRDGENLIRKGSYTDLTWPRDAIPKEPSETRFPGYV